MPGSRQRRRPRKRERGRGSRLNKVSTAVSHSPFATLIFLLFFFTEAEMDASKEEKNSVQTSSRPCCSCGKT